MCFLFLGELSLKMKSNSKIKHCSTFWMKEEENKSKPCAYVQCVVTPLYAAV